MTDESARPRLLEIARADMAHRRVMDGRPVGHAFHHGRVGDCIWPGSRREPTPPPGALPPAPVPDRRCCGGGVSEAGTGAGAAAGPAPARREGAPRSPSASCGSRRPARAGDDRPRLRHAAGGARASNSSSVPSLPDVREDPVDDLRRRDERDHREVLAAAGTPKLHLEHPFPEQPRPARAAHRLAPRCRRRRPRPPRPGRPRPGSAPGTDSRRPRRTRTRCDRGRPRSDSSAAGATPAGPAPASGAPVRRVRRESRAGRARPRIARTRPAATGGRTR
jgi:hypothetical protein